MSWRMVHASTTILVFLLHRHPRLYIPLVTFVKSLPARNASLLRNTCTFGQHLFSFLEVSEVECFVLFILGNSWRKRGTIEDVMIDSFSASCGIILSMTGDGLCIFGRVYFLFCLDLCHEDVSGGLGTVEAVSVVVSEH